MASPFVVHDPEFLRALGDAPRLDRVVDIDAHEGPVYIAHADALYFTSLPRPDWQVAIRRIALDGYRFPLAVDRVETLVKNTRVANGMTLDAGGQLLVCEQGSMAEGAAISRVDPRTGTMLVVVDNWGGQPLNSPNDIVVRSDGSIWFTDPSYGHLQGARVASSVVAVDKARTAAIFVRPSRDIEQQVSSGRLGALALRDAVALTGGIPLRADDEVVGAIGTSGETPDQDESVSLAGAAVSFTTTEVPALTYETARRVAEAVGTVATGRGVAPVVAVVEAEGHLVYLWRPDAAQVASVGVATDKARTAAIYRRPSKDFEDQAPSYKLDAGCRTRPVRSNGTTARPTSCTLSTAAPPW
jgi:uncharacterized protein GlcG (DUF336 family)